MNERIFTELCISWVTGTSGINQLKLWCTVYVFNAELKLPYFFFLKLVKNKRRFFVELLRKLSLQWQTEVWVTLGLDRWIFGVAMEEFWIVDFQNICIFEVKIISCGRNYVTCTILLLTMESFLQSFDQNWQVSQQSASNTLFGQDIHKITFLSNTEFY